MVLWHSKRPFTCATASQLHSDIVVCTIPYATGKMQRRKTCLFHTIKTKHKKPPCRITGCAAISETQISGHSLGHKHKRMQISMWKGHYVTLLWHHLLIYKLLPPAVSKSAFHITSRTFLALFFPLKCALAVQGPAYRFLFNQWS